MKSFLGRYYYCNNCGKPYDHKDIHKCSTLTDVCKLSKKPLHSEEAKNKIYCETLTVTVLTTIVLITTTMQSS